ncbi:MAG: hypothetical protein ACR2GG_11825 [Gemmatimonadaceae bacterium]
MKPVDPKVHLHLKVAGPAAEKLSWVDAAKAMAAAAEDWSEWEAVVADHLTEIPWDNNKNGAC